MTDSQAQGVVCSVDRLASEAGAEMLRAGGTAADAAVAANAVLTITAQNLCGLGGDLFALVHDGGAAPTALNSSGRAGSGADPDALRAAGHTVMPFRGDIRTVPVPGCVDGLLTLHGRYGRLPLAKVLDPAIEYAESGWPASPLLADRAADLKGVPGAEELAAIERTGAIVRRPRTAAALRAVLSDGRAGFYQGEFGRGLLELGNGEFTERDLRRDNAEWVTPLRVRAMGHDVWTAPPVSQGYLLLLALAIAEHLDLPDDPADPRWPHLIVEAARLAGHDRPSLLADGADVGPALATAAERAAMISATSRAAVPDHQRDGGTTYLCARDAEGMGVSLIQSNAAGFGSGLFEPRTGIGLQNRGVGFNLISGHRAEYRPGRRPPHTLVPAIVTRPDGTLRAIVGTMGGDSQPQILAQVLTRLLRCGQSPQQAVDAPRVRLFPGPTGFATWDPGTDAAVQLEDGCPPSWASGLRERGHAVDDADFGSLFGHTQLIDVGVTVRGAADPRATTAGVAVAG